MMAAVGSVYAHFYKIPGFEDVPTGLAALQTSKGLEGFSLLFFLIAGHEELRVYRDSKQSADGTSMCFRTTERLCSKCFSMPFGRQ